MNILRRTTTTTTRIRRRRQRLHLALRMLMLHAVLLTPDIRINNNTQMMLLLNSSKKGSMMTFVSAFRSLSRGHHTLRSNKAGMTLLWQQQQRQRHQQPAPAPRVHSSSLSSSSSPSSNKSTNASTASPATSVASADNSILDPLIVCGPSGVGKGSIIARYMDEMDGAAHFGFTVSHTTRQPRDGEIDGVHYHFIDKQEMESIVSLMETPSSSSADVSQDPAKDASTDADAATDSNMPYFLEYARVHGNLYGTSWDAMRAVQRQGKRCLLDIDVQGVKRIKSLQQDSSDSDLPKRQRQPQFRPKYIFIAPPSLTTLEQRLLERGSESAESLATRVGNAASEIEYGLDENNFDAVVYNDELDQAVHDFDRLVRELYDFG